MDMTTLGLCVLTLLHVLIAACAIRALHLRRPR